MKNIKAAIMGAIVFLVFLIIILFVFIVWHTVHEDNVPVINDTNATNQTEQNQTEQNITEEEAFFQIGFWDKDLPDDYKQSGFEANLDELAEGFNSIIAILPSNTQDCQIRMNTLSNLGIHVFRRGYYGEANDNNRENFLLCTEDYDNYLGWYSLDEPVWQGKSLDDIERFYNTLKSLDPQHKVMLNHAPMNTTEQLVPYSNYGDIISVDIYPLPNNDMTLVGSELEKIKETLTRDEQEVMIILQGFDHDGNNAGISPTYHQLRFMSYYSIIHGAKGLYYYGLHQIPIGSELWNNLIKNGEELKSVQNILALPDSRININVDNENIEFLLKEGNAYYLILANTKDEAQSVNINLLSIGSELIIKDLFEDTRLSINEGNLEDSFDSYEVKLFQIYASA